MSEGEGRREQNAAPRATEKARPGAKNRGSGGVEQARGRGRPAGAKNKPKSLVPAELAETLLLSMKDQLPAEHFDYVRGVIKDGKAVSTKRELQTLILLLSRNLWAALIDEMRPPEAPDNLDDAIEMVKETGKTEPKQVFRRDVTERLKVLNSLLGLLHQIEVKEEEKKDGPEPLLAIFAQRGLDRSRLAVLVGVQPDEQPAPVVIESADYRELAAGPVESGPAGDVGVESGASPGTAD